ncbi:MAG TPA: hypothetical protein PL037_09690, partial [Elusimicrobiales bacterium]|nr:hypothetical protein [Elusimicrobiales bacterium]
GDLRHPGVELLVRGRGTEAAARAGDPLSGGQPHRSCARCGTVLNVACRAIVNAAVLLYPVIPGSALRILSRAGAHSGDAAPVFAPRTEDPGGRELGADDAILFAKITEDQIKTEIEKLRSTEKPA